MNGNKDLSEIYNMIWTAGFNSGIKVSQEIADGKVNNPQELKERADELINEDADGIIELLKLKAQME